MSERRKDGTSLRTPHSVFQSFSLSGFPSFRNSVIPSYHYAPNNGIFKTLAKISITLNPVNTTKLPQANARSHAPG